MAISSRPWAWKKVNDSACVYWRSGKEIFTYCAQPIYILNCLQCTKDKVSLACVVACERRRIMSCVPARFRVGERASDNIALHLGCPSLNKVLKEALLGLEMVDLCWVCIKSSMFRISKKTQLNIYGLAMRKWKWQWQSKDTIDYCSDLISLDYLHIAQEQKVRFEWYVTHYWQVQFDKSRFVIFK